MPKNGDKTTFCIGGGGPRISLYQKVLPHAENALRNTRYNVNLTRIELPPSLKISKQRHYLTNDYHRMAFYGLSFSEVDIGRIIPQREVPPIEMPQPINADIYDRYVGRNKRNSLWNLKNRNKRIF
ncbi:MAG: hypothetical protein R2941_22540 [Desulfobacterales bacterium]